MGSSASRPRPPADGNSATYPPPPAPPFAGPFMLRSGISYRNNGDLYGSAYNRPVYPQAPAPPYNTPSQTPAPPVADKQLTSTQTIRNPINVKKSSVTLTPLPDAPHKLAVSFLFDASHECMLSVFVMATENADDGCKLIPLKQRAQPQHTFSKGLGLRYPKEGCQGVVIDTSLYSEADLTGAGNPLQFPLVIRGEAITEAAAAEGCSLASLEPGGAQKVWTQSQTTYCQLRKEEDGRYRVQVIKQKIWAMGTSYELQEIYGMQQAAAAAKEKHGIAMGRAAADSDDERMCVICLSIERDTTVLPCRHMCMCHECAQELRKQTSKCPICRNHVESLLHIRMSRQNIPKSATTPVDQSTVNAALEKIGFGAKDKRTSTDTRA